MARPRTLDLTAPDQPWRSVPMDGATMNIDVVPLASHPDDFVILARFPAGFSRTQMGGYHAAETFLVIEGELDFDGVVRRRGDLTHVPAEIVRTGMSTAIGCTALAWFSGPATFLAPDELGECMLPVTTTAVAEAAEAGDLLDTPEARWSLAANAEGETVDTALTRWTLDTSPTGSVALVRSRR